MPEAGKEGAVLNFLGRDRRSTNVKNNFSAGLVSSYPAYIGEGEGDVVHLDLLREMISQDGRRAPGNQLLQYYIFSYETEGSGHKRNLLLPLQ